MRASSLRNIGAAAIALALCGAMPAAAEEPVETALRTWISSIDASPDWQANYTGLAVDPASGRATLTGLAVTSERPGFALKVASLAVDGFSETGDGLFTAREIDLDDAELDSGLYSVRIDHAALEGPALPTTGAAGWDDARPFASTVKVLAPLMTARLQGARIGTVAVIETIGKVSTTTTYGEVTLEGMKDGKIAAVRVGSLRTDSPSLDPSGAGPPPLVTMKAEGAETQNIDLGALLSVYDPDRHANGVGDGIWRSAVGHVVYRSVGIDIPGIAVKFGGVSIDDFRLRQPKMPPDFGAAPDPASAATPAGIIDRLKTLSAYGVGRFAFRDLDISGAGIDRFHIADFALVNASTDAIGSFTVDGLEAAIGGQGSVKAGRLAFGGLVLPSIDTIKAALDARAADADVDYSSLIPPIGFVEMAGVNVALAALPAMQLGRLRLDLGQYIGKVPTSIAMAVAGADIPAALVPDDRARKILAEFGYDRVHVDGGAKVEWSDAGDITVRGFSLGVKDVGAVSGEADLAGITPAEAEHMAALTGAAGKLTVRRGTLAFKDDSIVGRVLSAQATRLNTDPAKFREQFAKGLPFMLMFLGDRNLIAELSPVLQTFIRTPGTISATAAPPQPVALAAILDAAKASPFSLFGMLGLSVSATAGPPPTETAPAPAIRTTITPAE